jgi:hypothetical protein
MGAEHRATREPTSTRPLSSKRDTDRNELRELVRRFQICWDTFTEYAYVDSEKQRDGYVLELCGTPQGSEFPLPCGARSKRVVAALNVIAESVLVRDDPSVACTISVFDQAIHCPPWRKFRPEVVVSIRIRPRKNHGSAEDQGMRCLKRTEGRLKALGAFESQFRDLDQEQR